MPFFERRHILAGSLTLPLAGLLPSAQARAAESRGSFEHRLRPTVHTGAERWTLAERMARGGVAGAAIAILRDGRVHSATGHGVCVAGRAAPVGPDTLFSVGSVSKVAAAALCLKLVALGHLDLDRNIERWLKRWRVPAGPAGDSTAITLRMLLSHTAGFNVHGFQDIAPDAPMPTLVQTLDGAAPALNKPLERIDAAGTRSRYSGGGYMIVQAVIEDALGAPFGSAARRYLFAPLGMKRSRFDAAPAADTPDIAHAHDRDGKPVALPRGWQSFPELAPSGLWTSANDLGRLVLALGASYRAPGGFLPQDLAVDMMTAVSPGSFGPGPRLAGEGVARIFHHAGANDSYKAYIEGNLVTGDGLVIVTNGANGDLLGDEIRNAVSDAFSWPGDWSVRTAPIATASISDGFVGSYKRRTDQSLQLAGILDTGFSADQIEIARSAEGVRMIAKGKVRKLVPVTGNRFVVPDAYIPAGTLQLSFDRGADRSVRSLTVIGGGGTLLFDKVQT
ncbi:MAG TPA: serine hydrolase domain-containing protein [Sphingopyxis sp.]|uniref:serine hydrolase domain-containing protein n=1 Tax=Sphingopyxis sp. TaxID=1908224 RepID=UPI002C5048B1|nr:serine hydrolase domain-containing protein [Sphingopyxis sp.]HWW57233.1 serine hydrolase domain-containing protein [Sphingopyxis sp.]